MPRANKCKFYKERGRRTAVRLYAMQQNERNTALYEAILRLNSLDECIRFFDDLCAVTELRTMEQRYAVAGCLLQGKVYSEIRRETGASSATVSRVNRMLNYGTGSVAESVREDLATQGVTADTKE
jgi:TrpR-related protein YerC/YecD